MNETNEEISLLEIFQEVKKRIWAVIYLTFIGAVAAFGLTIVTHEDQYEAYSTLVIEKESARYFYEDEYTQGDIDMYQKIANTYVEIAKSNVVLDKVTAQIAGYSRNDLKEMVNVSAYTGTLIMEIKVTAESAENARDITNIYTQAFMEECARILPVGQLSLVDEAVLPDAPLPAKTVLNTMIGFIAGGIIALVYIFLRMFMEASSIRKSEEVDQYLNINVAAVLK